MSETGETTRAIVARGDDKAWREIEGALKAGGCTLLRVPKLRRAYLDLGNGPHGAGISDTRLRKLERAGVLRFIGVDRYGLA